MSFDELTISLSGSDGRLSVETLAKSLDDALDMLQNVSSDMVASGAQVQWDIVRVQMRSPLRLTLTPRVTGGRFGGRTLKRKIVGTCLKGIKGIEETAILPPHFNESALEATKRLVRREGTLFTFSSNGKNKVTLTEKTLEHIDDIISKARLYIDLSTIEGYLEMVSVHHRASFFIWEVLTNHKIDCYGNDEQFDKALALLKKRPRIAVTGRIHYRNHVPLSIEVESVTVLRDKNALPQPKDIGPINITDGLSSEEFIRRMRNA